MGKNFFWDSNIFIAYINNEQSHSEELEAISSILENQNDKVFTSGISLAEVTPKRINNAIHNSFLEFKNSLQSEIDIINPSPNILINAGLLKDYPYEKDKSSKRVLTTGDAIMLATALEVEDTYGIKLEAFHTFDKGRGKGNPEGKGIPLIGFETWVKSNPPDLVNKVVNLNRCIPSTSIKKTHLKSSLP